MTWGEEVFSLVRKRHYSALAAKEKSLKKCLLTCVTLISNTNVNPYANPDTVAVSLEPHRTSSATMSEMLFQTSKGDRGRARPSVILIASTQHWFQASIERQLCYMSLLHHRSRCHCCSSEPQTKEQPSNSSERRALSKRRARTSWFDPDEDPWKSVPPAELLGLGFSPIPTSLILSVSMWLQSCGRYHTVLRWNSSRGLRWLTQSFFPTPPSSYYITDRGFGCWNNCCHCLITGFGIHLTKGISLSPFLFTSLSSMWLLFLSESDSHPPMTWVWQPGGANLLQIMVDVPCQLLELWLPRLVTHLGVTTVWLPLLCFFFSHSLKLRGIGVLFDLKYPLSPKPSFTVSVLLSNFCLLYFYFSTLPGFIIPSLLNPFSCSHLGYWAVLLRRCDETDD